MDIQRNENTETLLSSARDLFVSLFRGIGERPVLFLCSGGSALDLLQNIPPECFSSALTIGVLDERYSRDEAVNNFAQLQKTDFYKAAVCAGAHTIDTFPRADETLEMLARRFEGELKGWTENNQSGLMVATMGIGEDGHTAGIMPRPEEAEGFWKLFGDPGAFVQDYDAGEKNRYPLRITTTLPFLCLLNLAVVYCVGGKKRMALGRVLAEEGSVQETPARILREMQNVALFTDIML